MTTKTKFLRLFLLLVMMVATLGGVNVFADNTASELEDDTQTSFSVEAIQPDSQVDKSVSYFYFKVNPGEEQTLKTKLTNKTNQDLTVLVDVTDAGTNYHGNVDYFMVNPMLSLDKETKISTMVTLKEKEVVLKPNEEKIIELDVKTPKEAFEGIRLGGVSFKEKQEEKSGVTNTYKYLMSLVMTEDLQPHNRKGDLVFDNIEAKLHNGQKSVVTTLKNPEPFLIDKLNISTNLTKKSSGEQIAANTYTDVTVAPNSTYELLTYLGLESLKPGVYVMEIHGKNEEREWAWTEEFEILDQDAKNLNKNTDYKVKVPMIFIIFISILVVVTISLISFIVVRNKTNQSNNNK